MKHQNNTATAPKVADSKLGEFFISQLRDIYWAEQCLLTVIPAMRDAATSQKLKQSLDDHFVQTRLHATRLEEVFQIIDEPKKAAKCKAIAGIAEEAQDINDKTEKGTSTRDAGIIFAAQKVEHYEVATYGSLAQIARTLEHNDVADILEQTLTEEKETDRLLTEIAENTVNKKAYSEMS